MQIFGLEIQMGKWQLITIVVGCILAIIGLGFLFYYFRKRVWYAFVGATLAILIAIFIPLVVDQIFWIQVVPDNPLLTKIIWAFQTGLIVLVLKRIFGFGFDASSKSWQDQR